MRWPERGRERMGEPQRPRGGQVKAHVKMKVLVKLRHNKPGTSKSHQSLEKAKKDPPLESLEGARPSHTLISNFWPPEL